MSIAIIRNHEREMELVTEYTEPIGYGVVDQNGDIKTISRKQFNSLINKARNSGYRVLDYRDL